MNEKNEPQAEEHSRVSSIDGSSEALIERNSNTIYIVPMDDCIAEIVWSYRHRRIVLVVREKPSSGK